MGETAAEFDYEFIRDYIAQSLLRDLWDQKARLEFLRNFTTSEATPKSLSVPPVVGVGISESKDGKAQLQIVSTLEPDALLFEKFLAQKNWEDIRFHIKKTGVAVPCTRPAQGGDSISPRYGQTGTIGCAVKDRGSYSAPYLLSCNHVLAQLNRGEIGKDMICQPGADESARPFSRIGVLHRYIRIQFGPQATNAVDAALCKVDNTNDIIPGVRNLGALTGYVTNPPLGLRVKKQGCISGTTTGKLKIKNLSVIIKYDTGEEALFDKQLGIISTEPSNFAERGDSGSIVVDDNENAVGLLFSITQGVDLSFVNPVEAILNELQIALA
jgi:hypothetical protein